MTTLTNTKVSVVGGWSEARHVRGKNKWQLKHPDLCIHVPGHSWKQTLTNRHSVPQVSALGSKVMAPGELSNAESGACVWIKGTLWSLNWLSLQLTFRQQKPGMSWTGVGTEKAKKEATNDQMEKNSKSTCLAAVCSAVLRLAAKRLWVRIPPVLGFFHCYIFL